MPEYEGFYPDAYRLSDFTNVGLYPDLYTFKSKSFCQLTDSIEDGIKLISGETYEFLVSSAEQQNDVSVDVLCNATGKAVVEIVQSGLVINSGTNQGNSKETITLTSTAQDFKVRLRVLPLMVGKLAIAYFSNIKIKPNGSEYSFSLNDIFERTKIAPSGVSGSKIWVKVNGEWKQATVSII